MTNPNGIVLWQGPSQIDGAPIVVIATGLQASSGNVKTGALIQTWILRSDIAPHDALHTGADASICGACPHRGRIVDGRNVERACYVKVFQAPLSVFRSFERGIYAAPSQSDAAEMLRGKRVRLGAYGDPAAVPLQVWQSILQHAGPCTGYTHQWKAIEPAWAAYVMASCDSESDHAAAKALGFRTFRVRLSTEPVLPREIACPASAESGFKTVCASCVACGGTRSKARADIVIIAHGSGAERNLIRARANA
jgi:hypothetical protein